MEHQFRQLPADKQVETRPFLEAVSHLPPFFGRFFRHPRSLSSDERVNSAVMKRMDFHMIYKTIFWGFKVFSVQRDLIKSSKSYFIIYFNMNMIK